MWMNKPAVFKNTASCYTDRTKGYHLRVHCVFINFLKSYNESDCWRYNSV